MAPPRKAAPNKKKQSKRDRMKKYLKDNWQPITIGAGVTLVTIGTVVVLKRVIFPNQTSVLIKKMIIKDSIVTFATYARRMGPPSYLIECLETGDMWNSQLDASKAIGVSPSLLSARFGETNGKVAAIDGLHYVRRAMVTPRSG